MRYADLFVAGLGSYIPPMVRACDAIRDGDCPPEVATYADVESVAVSDGPAPPEMAAWATRIALDRAGTDPDDVRLLLHARGYFQGHDSWAAPSYVLRECLPSARECTAIEVSQMSNGAMAALELAGAYLSATTGSATAVISAGDRYCLPGYDRWRSEPATPLGDGGSAMVLRRGTGFARLVSTASQSEPALEGMHRGDDPFSVAPFQNRSTVDMAVTSEAFMTRMRLADTIRMLNDRHRAAVDQTLDEAGWTLRDVDWFVLPNLGKRRLDITYGRLLGIDLDRTNWSFGRRVGHAGPVDHFAGLEHLLSAGQLRAGQRCLLLGIGAGFTWSGAALEIVEQPAWVG